MFSQISISDGGGVHQPEAKCHIDLRSQLFHSWGVGVGWGGISAGRLEKCKVYG